MSTLDASLLPVAAITDAVVGRGADAVGASADANGQASGAGQVFRVHDVAAFAAALIQPNAFAVQTGRLAEGFFGLPGSRGDAATGLRVGRVSGFAHATIWSDAPTVLAAAVLAHGGGFCGSRLWTPAGLRVNDESVIADAEVGSNADPVRPAAVPALERAHRRDASAGIRVHSRAHVAHAPVRAHAGPVRTATVPAQRLGSRFARQGHAIAVRIASEPDPAVAHLRCNALAVRASSGTFRYAVTGSIILVARTTAAHTRSDALAVQASSRTLRHAIAVRIASKPVPAVAHAWCNALAVLASRTFRNAVSGSIVREARSATAHAWCNALPVLASLRTLRYALARLVQSEPFPAVAHTWSHALAVRTALRTVWYAGIGVEQHVAWPALALAWGNAISSHAALGTARSAGLGVSSRVRVPFATGTHARRSALSVATVLAGRNAPLGFDQGCRIRGGLQHVARLAPANPWSHTISVVATAWANRLALAVHLVEAQLAGTHVRGETVCILHARHLAERHAYAILREPVRRAAALVRRDALAAETSPRAAWLAGVGRCIFLVAVATVQDSDHSVRRSIVRC